MKKLDLQKILRPNRKFGNSRGLREWKKGDELILKMKVHSIRDWGTKTPRYLCEMRESKSNVKLVYFNLIQLESAKKI